MEIVKKDGFDSLSTADIVTFNIEEMQLLNELQSGADVQHAAENLKLGNDELRRCLENLVQNFPKDSRTAVQLAQAQVKLLKRA